MKYDAALKKLFHHPPLRLLSQVLGEDVVVTRMLPTELITAANLHPDILFETDRGKLIHIELQGYRQTDFAERNLLYYALILRDYQRHPIQIVFWLGPGKVGVGDGLNNLPALAYQYRLVNVQDLDGDELLEGDLEESIFAILCNLRNQREAIVKILQRIVSLPKHQQDQAYTELLLISGLRGLEPLLEEAAKLMPISIDIHDNVVLERIYQEGLEKGVQKGADQAAREILLKVLEGMFTELPASIRDRIETATMSQVRHWTERISSSSTLDRIFE
jgi:predicted transposase YdaD